MIKQRSKEWYEQRKGRVTGSVAGAVLGLNPWQTADDVLRAMVRAYHGAESEFKGNIATEYGTANESNVQWAYEVETGYEVEECGFFEFEDWLGASPDGLVKAFGLTEFKAPYGLRNGGTFKSLEDQPHYYAQIQIELHCTNKFWCDFVQGSPAIEGIYIERVQMNEEWLALNLPVLKQFHARFLSELDNPAHLEPRRKEITSHAAHMLVEEYEDLKDAIDRAKERQEDIMSELILYSGGKNATIGRKNLTNVERKGSVSYAQVVKEKLPDVDLAPYTGKPSNYWMLK